MKKYLLLMLAILTAGMVFIACERNGAGLHETLVTVYYPEGYETEVAAGLEVIAESMQSGSKDTVTTDENGVALFNLESGIYNFSASSESDELYFNGLFETAVIQPETNYMDLRLVASPKTAGLVFKEIYYTGSRTPEETIYYSDQFHEIFNNSDEVIYLDGLCIGVLEPSGASPSAWVNEDGSVMDRLPVVYHALMFPGSGTDNPIQPRTSVVLAQDAFDHKSDELGNANSPVDLGDAPYETYIEVAGKDTDAPGAQNLIIMYSTTTTMNDWLHPVNGAAVILFRLPTGLDYLSFVTDPDNFMTKPSSTSTMQYFMVHKDWVIDAVEIVRADETKRYKRLPITLDAGMIWCSGTYIGKSIVRKHKILGGKLIYIDTNNSTNDFIGEQTPSPFVLPTE